MIGIEKRLRDAPSLRVVDDHRSPSAETMAGEIEDDDEEMEGSLSEDEMEEFESEDDEAEVILDPRERAARSLEIRRAIEAKLEERKMRDHLDYLDGDDEDLDVDED
jgi:hypothetical protein